VINIFDKKIILAQHNTTGQQVIFKVLQKSAAVFKKSKTSLLPINISYMVGLLKYFETDEAVYLMLEYCPAGRLWEVVQPLVIQQLKQVSRNEEMSARKVSVLRPSESFIRLRKESVNVSVSDSDSEVSDLSLVHAQNNSLVVISNDNIDHYQCEEQETGEDQPLDLEGVVGAKPEQILDQAGERDLAGQPDLLTRIYGLEEKVKGHLSGALDIEQDTGGITEDGRCQKIGRKISEKSVVFSVENDQSISANNNDDLLNETSPEADLPKQTDMQKVERPKMLRKLSEVLPQCPDPSLPDSTHLPDRIVRLWAAELVQVLSSLHYREIIIKDLNPSNLLLDWTGHLKLTYQCEWVSIERELSSSAVQGRFTAPEVLSVLDVTPAADWWSFGAILHLLYTGRGPSSLVPTGLDSTIPLDFPDYIAQDARQFLNQLLQVYPVNRLGAGTTGSLDIRNHAYFNDFDWSKMTFIN